MTGYLADRIATGLVCFRYDVALLYLNQAKYDLDAAVEAYMSDEKWEKEHPLQASSKGKAKQTKSRRRIDASTG